MTPIPLTLRNPTWLQRSRAIALPMLDGCRFDVHLSVETLTIGTLDTEEDQDVRDIFGDSAIVVGNQLFYTLEDEEPIFADGELQVRVLDIELRDDDVEEVEEELDEDEEPQAMDDGCTDFDAAEYDDEDELTDPAVLDAKQAQAEEEEAKRFENLLKRSLMDQVLVLGFTNGRLVDFRVLTQ